MVGTEAGGPAPEVVEPAPRKPPAADESDFRDLGITEIALSFCDIASSDAEPGSAAAENALARFRPKWSSVRRSESAPDQQDKAFSVIQGSPKMLKRAFRRSGHRFGDQKARQINRMEHFR